MVYPDRDTADLLADETLGFNFSLGLPTYPSQLKEEIKEWAQTNNKDLGSIEGWYRRWRTRKSVYKYEMRRMLEKQR